MTVYERGHLKAWLVLRRTRRSAYVAGHLQDRLRLVCATAKRPQSVRDGEIAVPITITVPRACFDPQALEFVAVAKPDNVLRGPYGDAS